MSADRLEQLLGTGHDVRLGRRDVHDVLQKLRARGGQTEAAERLESRLSDREEIELPRSEAEQLLQELRASGRRWISGTDAGLVVQRTVREEPEPEPELEPRRRWRLWPRR
jgi:hypothetical protein